MNTDVIRSGVIKFNQITANLGSESEFKGALAELGREELSLRGLMAIKGYFLCFLERFSRFTSLPSTF
jgi:hypothetical protein